MFNIFPRDSGYQAAWEPLGMAGHGILGRKETPFEKRRANVQGSAPGRELTGSLWSPEAIFPDGNTAFLEGTVLL